MNNETEHNPANPEKKPDSQFNPAAIVAPLNAEKTKTTAGEKIFDASAYWGLGWLANASFSVWLTDKIAQGGGYRFFDEKAHSFGKKWPFVQRKLSDESIAAGKSHLKNFQQIIFDGGTELAEKLEQASDNGKNARLKLPDIEAMKAEGKLDHEVLREIKKSLKTYSEHHTVSHGNIAQFIVEHSPQLKTQEQQFSALGQVEDYYKFGTAKGKARSMGVLLTLMSGGFALMAPIKFLEDHKEGIVTKLDDIISPEDKRSAAEAAAIDARHHKIAEEPKQTWGSELAGRSIALVPILGTHFAFGNQANVLSKWGREFAGLDNEAKRLAAKTTELLESTRATKGMMEKAYGFNQKKINKLQSKYEEMSSDPSLTKAQREAAARAEKHFKYVLNDGKEKTKAIFSYANLDAGYSLAAASMTYGATRLTNKWFNHDKPEAESQSPPSAPAEKKPPSSVLHATKGKTEGKVAEHEHTSTRA